MPDGNSPTREQIEKRAYEIYLERGGGPGDPLADWLKAEAELAGLSRERVPRSPTADVLFRRRRNQADRPFARRR